jgi:hypothetical protein
MGRQRDSVFFTRRILIRIIIVNSVDNNDTWMFLKTVSDALLSGGIIYMLGHIAYYLAPSKQNKFLPALAFIDDA